MQVKPCDDALFLQLSQVTLLSRNYTTSSINWFSNTSCSYIITSKKLEYFI